MSVIASIKKSVWNFGAISMQGQSRLLVHALDRHEPHVRALDRLAHRRCVRRIVLAPLAAQPAGRDEFRRHQPHQDRLAVLFHPVHREHVLG